MVLLDSKNEIVEGGDEVEETAFFVHVPTHRLLEAVAMKPSIVSGL